MEMVRKILSKFTVFKYFIKYKLMKHQYDFPFVYSSDETIQYLKETGKSVARFGDGEFNVMTSHGIGFQNKNEHLANRLLEILKDTSGEFCEVLIPRPLHNMQDLTIRSKLVWQQLISDFYLNYEKYLDKSKKYYNTNFTRFYIDLKDKEKCNVYIENLKQLWADKDILIVEGKNGRLGVGNDLFAGSKSIKRVITKDKDAYSVYDKILSSAKSNGKNKLVLIALGPTATVLAYDLAKDGYYAMDIGHLDVEYEWFLLKVKSKVKLKGKNVNELGHFYDDDNFSSAAYAAQIIEEIK